MTRGKAIIVMPRSMVVSTEFNGDMSPYCNGGIMIDAVKNCKTEVEIENALKLFDARLYCYGEHGERIYNVRERTDIDFEKDRVGYTDYIYIFNKSDEDISVKDIDGQEVIGHDKDILIFHFLKYLRKADEPK